MARFQVTGHWPDCPRCRKVLEANRGADTYDGPGVVTIWCGYCHAVYAMCERCGCCWDGSVPSCPFCQMEDGMSYPINAPVPQDVAARIVRDSWRMHTWVDEETGNVYGIHDDDVAKLKTLAGAEVPEPVAAGENPSDDTLAAMAAKLEEDEAKLDAQHAEDVEMNALLDAMQVAAATHTVDGVPVIQVAGPRSTVRYASIREDGKPGKWVSTDGKSVEAIGG